MPYKDPEDRRAFQRAYYKRPERRAQRATYRRVRRAASPEARGQDAQNSQAYRTRLRREVFDQDQGRCHYCQDAIDYRTFQMDHKIPLREKGRTVRANLVAACRPCNALKSFRWSYEAFMCLKRPDYVPAWVLDDLEWADGSEAVEWELAVSV
jgi:5-methylcytosine-specific restriction endonuclease McrA